MHKQILVSAFLMMSALIGRTSEAQPGASAMSTPSDTNITGHVVDTETGEHLPYYTVKIAGTSIATMTDASGHYTLRNLTPGHYTVEASSMGYAAEKREIDRSEEHTSELQSQR